MFPHASPMCPTYFHTSSPPQNIFTLKILCQSISTVVAKWIHFQVPWGFLRCMFIATENFPPLPIWSWIGNKFQNWLQIAKTGPVSVKIFQTKMSHYQSAMGPWWHVYANLFLVPTAPLLQVLLFSCPTCPIVQRCTRESDIVRVGETPLHLLSFS